MKCVSFLVTMTLNLEFYLWRFVNGESTCIRLNFPNQKFWSNPKTGAPRRWAASSRASGWRATPSTRPRRSLFARLTGWTSRVEVRRVLCPRPHSASDQTRRRRECRPPASAFYRWVSKKMSLKQIDLPSVKSSCYSKTHLQIVFLPIVNTGFHWYSRRLCWKLFWMWSA